MRGDSLAEEPNSPEAQESLEAYSPPVEDVKESSTPESQVNSDTNSLSLAAEDSNQKEVLEKLESNSPVLATQDSRDPEILENSTTYSPQAAAVEEAKTSQPPEDLAANSQPETASKATFASAASSETPPMDTSRLRIFITGASGCVGQYLTEALIKETQHELFLLVRDPAKLQFDCNARPGIHVLRGDMRDMMRHSRLLKTINCAILIATSWGGPQLQVLDVNIYKNIQLLSLLDPEVCQHIIYFSTASVLDRDNEILKEAAQLGTDYIRSKSAFLGQVSRLPIAKKMTILFPTLVVGGDANHPYSHLSAGLPGVTKWINLIRFFKADGSFHFIHAEDIARVVRYLVDNPPTTKQMRKLVLGNPAMTANQAVEEACAYLGKKILFRIPLKPWLADLIIALFHIEMSPWDRFCLSYRNFTYQDPVNPATFGLPVYCATLSDVLKVSGVPPQGAIVEPAKDYKFQLDEPEVGSETEN